MSETDITKLRDRIQEEVGNVIVGQEEAVDLLFAALLTGGNVLLEGPPGTAKTLLGRAFAAALSLDFGRIQFTPDLMPGDVLGMNLFNFESNSFVFSPGTDLHGDPAGGRSEPHAAQNPGRVAGGYERTDGHD